MTDRIRVLIADDHPVFRDGLHALVEAAPDLELVGEATTGVEAVDLAASGRPAVILMDLRMPELSGIEATRRILEADPTVGILIVTMSEDDESLFAAMRAGRARLHPEGRRARRRSCRRSARRRSARRSSGRRSRAASRSSSPPLAPPPRSRSRISRSARTRSSS